jgi:hypothetical protein
MSVMITRRGLALVRIEPIQEQRLTGHAPLEKLKEEVIALERIVNCSSIAIAGGEPLL